LSAEARLRAKADAGRGRPAKRSEAGRVRGSRQEHGAWREPLTPPSPRKNGVREKKDKLSSRHCERSEAIHTSHAEERMDCFVACATRNDGEHNFAISPQVCARLGPEFPALSQ
jgi:hypothetical protein